MPDISLARSTRTDGGIDVTASPRRVLVIGTGVIGTVYAARLAASGLDVTVQARGDRLRELQADGAVIVRAPGHELVQARIRAVADASGDGFDLVIVAVRREQALEAVGVVARVKSPTVLWLGNFAGLQSALTERAGPERTILGFPGVGGRRDSSVVRYVQIRQQPTTLGRTGARNDPALQIARALRLAGFGVTTVADMAAWLDTHAAFIVPIAAAVRIAGGRAGALAQDQRLVRLMVLATREAYRALARVARLAAPLNLRLLYRIMPVRFACWYWRRALRGEFGELAFAAHTRHAWPELAALAERVEEWFQEAAGPGTSSGAFRELLGRARQATPSAPAAPN